MERKYKIRLQRKSGVWFACTEWDARHFDIVTTVVAIGDTPEQAYNEWQRLAGMAGSCRGEEEYVLTWEWLFIIPLAVSVLVWIFG